MQDPAPSRDSVAVDGTGVTDSDAIHKSLEMHIRQSSSLHAALERLNIAVEALKPQPPASDRPTAFWTAYKTLADEFDSDFQKQHGADLDTGLIFVFSQQSALRLSFRFKPELQPDPNTTGQALVMFLVANITGSAVPIIPSGSTNFRTILVAQSLLYFSLFSTLGAALLAVLAKQWLLHYDSIGEQGTIEERGLERQRKYDSLRYWKFDVAMQIFPLLLQFSLLLFAMSLSIYLWTVHQALAAIGIGMTALGVIVYFMMVLSALLVPDSPFQTSLTILLTIILRTAVSPGFTDNISERSASINPFITRYLKWFRRWFRTANSGFKRAFSPILPLFKSTAPATAYPLVPIFQVPEISEEIPAILWALERSTDPRMVEAAAALVPDLQWPVNPVNIQPAKQQLADTFWGCFDGDDVRHGMGDRATSCIKAIGVFGLITEWDADFFNHWETENLAQNGDKELISIIRYFRDPRSVFDEPPISQWSLRFIAAQNPVHEWEILSVLFHPDPSMLNDKSIFADWLFCINSCFVKPVIGDLSVLEKRYDNMPMKHVSQIVKTVAQFANTLKIDLIDANAGVLKAVYAFCKIPTIPRETALLALRIAATDVWHFHNITMSYEAPWVYCALDDLEVIEPTTQVVNTFGDLLQAAFHSALPSQPSIMALRVILSAATQMKEGGPDIHRMKNYAVHLLFRAHEWFLNSELQPMLENPTLWDELIRRLTEGSIEFPRLFISLANKISHRAEFKNIISRYLLDLLTCLPALLFWNDDVHGTTQTEFRSVLARVWDLDADETDKLGNQKTLAMAFIVLSNAWNQLDVIQTQELAHFLLFIRCTVSTVFCVQTTLKEPPSDEFTHVGMVPLGDALSRAAARLTLDNLRVEPQPGIEYLYCQIYKMMSELASFIHGDLQN
ncbi:hypothetical protein C8R43DRAFT_1104772 [Mycena crocata]|nr:hypothetical protein C8R43DRAFT_1104772 [Mycena crocata]